MTNHNHHHHHRLNHNHHLLPPHTTTRSTSTIQACAACRYQRRKCAPDCLLAPYFPHDRQRQFQNAHKLFGVSNITKIIRHLDQPRKDEAMRTIIYQSDVRAQDPVGGCYRIIRELQRQIDAYRADLEIVLQHLAFCRTLAVQTQNQSHHPNLDLNHHDVNQIAIVDDDNDVHCDINNSSDEINLYDDPPPSAAVDEHDLRRRAQDQNRHPNPNPNLNLNHHDNNQIAIIDDVNCDVRLVNSSSDDLNLYDDPPPPSAAVDVRRRGLDLDLRDISLQREARIKDHDDRYVHAAAVAIQSWTAVDAPSSSPLQTTLHASMCDEFKSLLIDDDIPPGDRSEVQIQCG